MSERSKRITALATLIERALAEQSKHRIPNASAVIGEHLPLVVHTKTDLGVSVMSLHVEIGCSTALATKLRDAIVGMRDSGEHEGDVYVDSRKALWHPHRLVPPLYENPRLKVKQSGGGR